MYPWSKSANLMGVGMSGCCLSSLCAYLPHPGTRERRGTSDTPSAVYPTSLTYVTCRSRVALPVEFCTAAGTPRRRAILKSDTHIKISRHSWSRKTGVVLTWPRWTRSIRDPIQGFAQRIWMLALCFFQENPVQRNDRVTYVFGICHQLPVQDPGLRSNMELTISRHTWTQNRYHVAHLAVASVSSQPRCVWLIREFPQYPKLLLS